MGVVSYPASTAGIPETEIGASYASGTSSATIVSAGANTNGVRVSTVAIFIDTLTSDGEFKVDGDIIMKAASFGNSAAGQVAMTGLFVPAGQAIAFTLSNSNAASDRIAV